MNAPTSFLERLSRLVSGLSGALAAVMARGDNPIPLFVVWRFLDRLNRRVERLVERLARGESVRPRWALTPDLFCLDRPPPLAPPAALPRTGHWLERQGIETEDFLQQLRELFADPAFLAFLTAAPQLWPGLHHLSRLLGAEWPAEAPRRTRRRQAAFRAGAQAPPPRTSPPPPPPAIRPAPAWDAPIRPGWIEPAPPHPTQIFFPAICSAPAGNFQRAA